MVRIDKVMSVATVKYAKKDSDKLTYALAILLTTIILIIFLFNSKDLYHPFIFPIYFSGIIIALDLVDWARGKIEVFSPIGFLGIFGFHFFFLSPILQVYWESGMNNVVEPQDWRVWLLGIGFINLIGLILYRFFRRYFYRKQYIKSLGYSKWEINSRKLLIISIPILLIMFLLQTYIYITYGGFKGYIDTYINRDGGFEGMGFIFTIAESFPIIFIILSFHFIQKSRLKDNMIVYFLLFLIFFLLKLYFGGLRGSRSNTLWGLIWFVGIYHSFVKPVKKRTIILGSILILSFVFLYGIYKGSGDKGLEIFGTNESITELADDTGRGIDTVLLGDLSRFRTQSFILYRLIEHPNNYQYSLGRSYIGDISIMIPKRFFPNRPPTKVKEGTEIILGEGNYNPNKYVSSRIYGLTGEFMLNFGYIFAPFTFVILALFVAKVSSFFNRLNTYDARLYLYPFFVILCFLLLVQDLDNMVFSLIKNLFIPLLILLLVTEKQDMKENKYATSIRT